MEKIDENSIIKTEFHISHYLKDQIKSELHSQLGHYDQSIQNILEDNPTAEIYQDFLEKIKIPSPLPGKTVSSNQPDTKRKKDLLNIITSATPKLSNHKTRNSPYPREHLMIQNRSFLPQINRASPISEKIIPTKLRSRSVKKPSYYDKVGDNDIYEARNNSNNHIQEVSI